MKMTKADNALVKIAKVVEKNQPVSVCVCVCVRACVRVCVSTPNCINQYATTFLVFYIRIPVVKIMNST